MNVLLIGGTGNISAASVRLALQRGHQVTLLNRGQRPLADYEIHGAESLIADIHDEAATLAALGERTFDVVANFIAFHPADIERDIRLFQGRCAQYIFISSASAYQKPLAQAVVTESTPLKNPYWDYSRAKIACEEACIRAYRQNDFPVTIVRPSLTYDTVIPTAIGGWNDYTIIQRMRQRRPVVVHGDGSSLWTMTHATDFAKGFVGLLCNQQAIGEAFHITSDELLTWNQIYDAVGIAAGTGPVEKVHIPSSFIAKVVPTKKGSLLGDKAVSTIFDNSKIKRIVPDYQATTPFQRGIQRTLAWFEAKPKRMQTNQACHQLLDSIINAYKPAYDAARPS
ncbi:SDR family oxidoreductase [Coraliomargarita sp. SDUM461004]|uniref:SDR family oxidoreductase n=1 Tax=Thalassobacterium sedimentorum TaxID=3041258 RepID=A0ABU1AHI1_9BACT|nr:SDR family oxidoreductase [Coraliomargarita sp. SDUM461004]MDQ8194276.1 SDR family oxidoreductase [Coraliomargarita sp. SDUM461004]